MKNIIILIFAVFIASQAWSAQGSSEGSTWKTIDSVIDTGANKKSIWIEIRYQGYPNYYQRSLNEADCAKKLLRTLQSETYSNDGVLVKSEKPKNEKPYYGYVTPISNTPSEEIFNAICGKSKTN